MKITIEFDTDNAAFEDEQGYREILKQATNRAMLAIYARTEKSAKLLDYNGNTVGTVRVEASNAQK
jgi:hypothetical protein